MASLLRHSRAVLSRFATAHRTATTSAVPANLSKAARSGEGAVGKRLSAPDAVKPRPVGETPLVPLVGKSMTSFGNIGLGLFVALSAYFVYLNYITNPEFYKSLKLSREATKRDSHRHTVDHAEKAH